MIGLHGQVVRKHVGMDGKQDTGAAQILHPSMEGLTVEAENLVGSPATMIHAQVIAAKFCGETMTIEKLRNFSALMCSDF